MQRNEHSGRASDAQAARFALVAFVCIEVAAFALFLYLGRDRWFRYDEWDFLASRRATSLHDLFEPHVVHWSTLPILLYRALWQLFGLRSYMPYQAAAVILHLGVAALARAVMRRAGVGPWTATAAATLLVLLASGDENILWAFGVTFTGSLAFGLVQLLLADHDGRVDRRDWLALVAGLGALMCSGIGVTMVVVVGLASLARRGWRAAAFQTVPLAIAYAAWYLAIGADAYDNQPIRSASEVFEFAWDTLGVGLDRIAQVWGLGWVLVALVIGGCYLAWRNRPLANLRRTASAPLAMAVGALVFVVVSGLGRGTELSGATRYTHVLATLLVPVIGVAADAMIRRWRAAAPVLACGLAVAVVGNVRVLYTPATHRANDFMQQLEGNMLVTARLATQRDVPRDLRPDPSFAPWVSIGWLADGVRSGRIPRPEATTRRQRATAELALVLRHLPGHRPRSCSPTPLPAHVTLRAGSALVHAGPVVIRLRTTDGTESAPVRYAPSFLGSTLTAVSGPLDLRVSAVSRDARLQTCDLGGAPFTVPPGP